MENLREEKTCIKQMSPLQNHRMHGNHGTVENSVGKTTIRDASLAYLDGRSRLLCASQCVKFLFQTWYHCPPSSFVCHASAISCRILFPYRLRGTQRRHDSSSSTTDVNSPDGEEAVVDRIDRRPTQARWLGRIRVAHLLTSLAEKVNRARVAVGNQGGKEG